MNTISLHNTKTRTTTILAGVIGNVMEWYDFAIYGFFAPILGRLFFPSEDATTSLIASFGAFAAGFLMRPIGGALFGHIGDRIGRKRALNLSVLMMAVPTFLIGLMPTYAQIGVGASIILVAMRMLQGLSVGGEYTSSIVYLAECAPKGKRGLFTCTSTLGSVCGIMVGSMMGSAISAALTEEQLASWGWRIPFLLGILVAGTGFLIRRHMPESLSEEVKIDNPLRQVFKNWRGLLTVAGLNMLTAVAFYAVFVFVVAWLVQYVHEPRTLAFQLNSYSMLVFLLAVPFFAWLSDRFGRRPLMIIAALGTVLCTYPLVWLMHHSDPAMILIGQVGMAILISAYASPIPAALTEMFPTNVRVSSVGVGYNLAYAIFGGTTPMVCVWLIQKEHSDLSFAWYIMAAAAISLVVVLFIRERAHDELPE